MKYVNRDDEIAELRKKYIELMNKRRGIKSYSLYRLKVPFFWTIFFAIAGIVHQSIEQKKFVFVDFFWKNYISWFNSFGNFVSVYQASGLLEVLLKILSGWYYFFFTGGLLALLWAIIYVLTHLHVHKEESLIPRGRQ